MCPAAASPSPWASWCTYLVMLSIEVFFFTLRAELPLGVVDSSFAKAGSLRRRPPRRFRGWRLKELLRRVAALALPGSPVPRFGEFGAGLLTMVEQRLLGLLGQVEVGGLHAGGVDEDGAVLNAWLIDVEAVVRAGEGFEQGHRQVDRASGGSQIRICAGWPGGQLDAVGRPARGAPVGAVEQPDGEVRQHPTVDEGELAWAVSARRSASQVNGAEEERDRR